MKIAILGYGLQGKSAYEYWHKAGNEILICDQNPDLEVPKGANVQLGPDYLKGLADFDILVRIASLHPRDLRAAYPDNPDLLSRVTTNTNEFFKVCPTKNIIGVTGTKGKGTTCTLIAKILEASGKKVHLGGNIGTPPLDMLKVGIKPDDWVVLELANFQLIDLKYSPHIAACLMVVPEHQDWHEDMDEYIAAKQQLFLRQTVDDIAIYNRNSAHSQEVAKVSVGKHLSYEVPGPGAEPSAKTGAYVLGDTINMDDASICKISDVALLGRHNLDNVCAAIAATWQITNRNSDAIKKVISSFKGLEHRLELVRELNGVQYYDDSFGTTPETAIVAIQAFDQPKVVILGGSDKGAEFADLAQVVAANNVKAVILIGDTAPQIEQALKAAGYEHIVVGGGDMKSIVAAAQAQALPGDVVLLSTACASFDMFKNYKDRGEQFKAAVQALQ